jgi:hypothetical protein
MLSKSAAAMNSLAKGCFSNSYRSAARGEAVGMHAYAPQKGDGLQFPNQHKNQG